MSNFSNLEGQILRRGSRGDYVRELQAALAEQGFQVGAVDGIFGRQTQAALMAFQEANGLSTDGVFGPASFGKLAVGSTGHAGSRSGEQAGVDVAAGAIEASRQTGNPATNPGGLTGALAAAAANRGFDLNKAHAAVNHFEKHLEARGIAWEPDEVALTSLNERDTRARANEATLSFGGNTIAYSVNSNGNLSSRTIESTKEVSKGSSRSSTPSRQPSGGGAMSLQSAVQSSDKAERVALQMALAGFHGGGAEVTGGFDGILGRKSRAAMDSFEQKTGLSLDGKSIEEMNSLVRAQDSGGRGGNLARGSNGQAGSRSGSNIARQEAQDAMNRSKANTPNSKERNPGGTVGALMTDGFNKKEAEAIVRSAAAYFESNGANWDQSTLTVYTEANGNQKATLSAQKADGSWINLRATDHDGSNATLPKLKRVGKTNGPSRTE